MSAKADNHNWQPQILIWGEGSRNTNDSISDLV